MLIGRENQTRVRPETTKHIYSSVSYFYIALIHRKSKLGGGGHRLIQYWLNVDWLIDRLARLRLNRTDRVSSILRRRLHFTVDIAKNRLLSKNQERERDRDNFLPFFFLFFPFRLVGVGRVFAAIRLNCESIILFGSCLIGWRATDGKRLLI